MNYSSLEPLSSTDKRAEKYPCAAKFVGAASHHIVVGIGESRYNSNIFQFKVARSAPTVTIQQPLLDHELIDILPIRAASVSEE
jgi:hypothetical protein